MVPRSCGGGFVSFSLVKQRKCVALRSSTEASLDL